MIKVFSFADLHIGVNFGSYSRDNDIKEQLEYIKNIVTKDMSLSLKDKRYLVIPGDLYENPNPTPRQIAIMSKFLEDLEKFGIEVFLIYGNHDIVKNSKPLKHALEPFKYGFKNVKVIEEPTRIDLKYNYNLLLIPYGYKIDDVDKKLYNSDSIVFTHYDYVRSKEHWYLKDILLHVSGDIHTNNFMDISPYFVSLGSIVKCDMGEMNDEKFMLEINLEPDDISKKLIPLPNREMFRIEWNTQDDYILVNEKHEIDLDDEDFFKQKDCLLDIVIKVNSEAELLDKDNELIIKDFEKMGYVRNKNIIILNKIKNVKKIRIYDDPKKMVQNFIRNNCNKDNKKEIIEKTLELMV